MVSVIERFDELLASGKELNSSLTWALRLVVCDLIEMRISRGGQPTSGAQAVELGWDALLGTHLMSDWKEKAARGFAVIRPNIQGMDDKELIKVTKMLGDQHIPLQA